MGDDLIDAQDFKDDHVRIKINQIQQKETVRFRSFALPAPRSRRFFLERAVDSFRRTTRTGRGEQVDD